MGKNKSFKFKIFQQPTLVEIFALVFIYTFGPLKEFANHAKYIKLTV